MTALMIASYRGQLSAVQRLMAERPPPSIEMRDVVCAFEILKRKKIIERVPVNQWGGFQSYAEATYEMAF